MTDFTRRGQSPSVSDPQPGSSPLPAFRVLFDQHYGFVWRTLRHYGLSSADADDAVQDVFIVVHRRLPDFDGRTHLRSWLFGIARRVARGVQRADARRERRLQLVSAPEPATSPDEVLARQEAEQLVESFLETLPADQRDVFYLADVEGLTGPEIADALGTKLNTIYSRLRTARRRFEKVLARRELRERRTHA